MINLSWDFFRLTETVMFNYINFMKFYKKKFQFFIFLQQFQKMANQFHQPNQQQMQTLNNRNSVSRKHAPVVMIEVCGYTLHPDTKALAITVLSYAIFN